MARGKIQIKRIENSTNRQVTYSKRRNGLFKKANELAVLCDAKVSIIMFSTTGKLHEYMSPSITTKQMLDQYQKTVGVDIWSTHYERMQEQLRKLKDVNRNLRTEIRQRMGDCLNDLSFEELRGLEHEMTDSITVIRERKNKVITNQIETYKKKLRNVEEIHRNLLHEFDAREEDPQYGLVDNGGDYESVIGFQDGGARNIFALRMNPNHLHHAPADLTTYPLLD
ncbi:agamous-like MADS-box protein AP3 [Mercurialis annua]|uniref:Apetala 3-like protein n=1 Tax=Mercurialis annua TaxID=3986 RepID=A0A0P0I7J5_MERAN|nr:agamous-like MADS-box protein AP3 [Mercurialis annua]ALK01327.2 apetala 3-like protein [Mercurialis annua]